MADPRRVGVIGYGAIGSVVADALARGAEVGLALAGVLADSPVPPDLAVATLEELVADADLVVEAASHAAVAQHAETVLAAGVDLLAVSVGALVDDDLRARLVAAGAASGARLLVSSGAIGGLDLLRAAAALGPLEEVSMTSTKPVASVVAPWMDGARATALRQATRPVTAFEGTAREAARAFPASANVAATLGLATLGLDAVHVRIVGDPAATRVRHVIAASGPTGEYEVAVANVPSPLNPRTSAVTPGSVLRALRDLGAPVVVGA